MLTSACLTTLSARKLVTSTALASLRSLSEYRKNHSKTAHSSKNVPKCVHMIESRLGTAQAVPRFGSIYVVRAPCRVRPLVSTSSRGPKSGVRMPDRDPRDA